MRCECTSHQCNSFWLNVVSGWHTHVAWLSVTRPFTLSGKHVTSHSCIHPLPQTDHADRQTGLSNWWADNRKYNKSERAAAMVVFIARVLALGLPCQGGCWRTAPDKGRGCQVLLAYKRGLPSQKELLMYKSLNLCKDTTASYRYEQTLSRISGAFWCEIQYELFLVSASKSTHSRSVCLQRPVSNGHTRGGSTAHSFTETEKLSEIKWLCLAKSGQDPSKKHSFIFFQVA